MRKFMSALCLLAILCVAGLVFTQLYDGENPAMEDIGAGTDELVDQVKDMYRNMALPQWRRQMKSWVTL